MPASRFVWHELTTSDPDAAVDFYAHVLQVDVRDATVPGGPRYAALLAGGVPIGGIAGHPCDAGPESQSPAWTGYIAVDDVDAMAARLLAAGGRLHRPAADIPGVGRFAAAADPQGAGFNLFTPLPAGVRPAPAPRTPGSVGWNELTAVAWKPAFEFYSTLFGWTLGQGFDMGPLGVYQQFDIDGVPSGGMLDIPPGVPTGGWRGYFNVDAIDAAGRRIEQAGGRVLMPAHQVPDGDWILLAVDPQGGQFAAMARER